MLKMVITDLDGTLTDPSGKISNTDLNVLRILGKRGIKRVIATGRSMFSAKKVLADALPIDYLIFSGGAGIYDWQNKRIIKDNCLNKDDIQRINAYLFKFNLDFMIHLPIPENHKFIYYSSGSYNPDFEKRLSIYKDFSDRININRFNLDYACQYVVIIPEIKTAFERISEDLNRFSVIRTTSPLDHKTLWIEIFPSNVSKGYAAAWLSKKLKINSSEVLSVGNDYNDLDLLEWSGHSYVVDNAPEDLKCKFNITTSNSESAYMHAVKTILKL